MNHNILFANIQYIMSTTAIIITGFIIFTVVMLAFAIYDMKHAYKVYPNAETFLD